MNENQLLSLNSNRLETISQDIFEEAARLGATQAEVSMAVNKGFSVTARGGEVETIEYTQDKIVDITVYIGKRTGSASLSDLQPASIRAAVQAACHIAKFTDEDPAAGLAEPSELALAYPQLTLAFPWNLSVEDAIQIACQCESEALSYDKRIMSAEEATVATVEACHFYANSHGFVGFFPVSRHEISCVLVAKEKDEMQRDFSYTVAVDPLRLESVSSIAKQAAERTVARLGARTLPTMKVPVIFSADEARGLLGHFASAIQGSRLYRQSSFLLNQLHHKIFPDFIQMQEQPHLVYGLSSAPFDEDGVATRANKFVENGVLCSYSLGVYSARKLGMQTTGNAGGLHNLVMTPGQDALSDLLKKMDTGLLITELMGNGVNILTGDYSRGASGFWVEKGDIQYPVHEVTIAGKLQDIYAQIQAVGKDVDVRGTIHTGSILVDEMMVAGH
jgi:PmbA protein